MDEKTKNKDGKLTRRDFMKATGGATAFAGVAATGLLMGPRKVEAAGPPQKWDEEFDVLVFGSSRQGHPCSEWGGIRYPEAVSSRATPVMGSSKWNLKSSRNWAFLYAGRPPSAGSIRMPEAALSGPTS